jgi:hypothetical protein
MPPMIRSWLAVAAFLCLSSAITQAQAQTVEREIKAMPGKEVRVGVFINIRPDCVSGPLPAIRLAVPPEHGAVTVKRATLKATNLKQCLAAEVPAFVALYRANDGFSGADAFVLEIVAAGGGHRTLEHVQVTVSNPAAGQGI